MLGRFIPAVSLLSVMACAEGGELAVGGGGSGGDGSGATGPSSTTGHGAGPTTQGPSTSPASSGVSNGGMGGDGGVGGDGGMGGMPTTNVGGGPMCDFSAPESCDGAEVLPAIAGDQGNESASRTGVGSKWFKIHIEEEDGSVFESDMSYRVTLASPASVNYDLRVYESAEGAPPNCGATPVTGTGSPENVSNNWDDSQGIGGENDSLWIIIEIAHVSGDECAADDQWTLQVQGNI